MSVPVPPEGWQYGVVMSDARLGRRDWVWGCGSGEAGRKRQRMRLRYPLAVAPCLLTLTIPADEPDPLGEAVRALYRAVKGGVIDDDITREFERVAPKEWTQ